MTGYLFRDRAPKEIEMEELRLMLSTFRDGSGQQANARQTEPGWRDVERVVAALTRGQARENKGVFDVTVPFADGLPYGLSCKTSAVTSRAHSSVLFELHNSNAKAWEWLGSHDLDPQQHPAEAGLALIAQVTSWHNECIRAVDVAASSYVVLIHDKATWTDWRLLWYPLDLNLIPPEELHWEHIGKRVQGTTADGHRLWEWYGWSGGQLKYYPPIEVANWVSEWFQLEEDVPSEDLRVKAARAFPDKWPTRG
jgi:hypothetical protein